MSQSAQKTTAQKIFYNVSAPARFFKNHPILSLIFVITAIGVAALAMGLYSFLSHGVVNAALGQPGNLGLIIGGSTLAGGGGILLLSVGGLKGLQYHNKKKDQKYRDLL